MAARDGRADYPCRCFLVKVLQFLLGLDLLIFDPMRSNSFFHWRPWFRAYKLKRAVQEKNKEISMQMFCLVFQNLNLQNIIERLEHMASGKIQTNIALDGLSPAPLV